MAFCAYYLIDIHRFLNIYDEGYSVFGAVRIMQGEVPYRDFWVIYPPGQFYVLAALFSVFGPSIPVERLYDVAVRVALGVAAYVLARQLTKPRLAIFTWALVGAALLPPGFYYGYPIYPALLFILLGVAAWLRWVRGRSLRWLVISGVAMGGATLFRHDFGAYAALAGGLTTLALVISAPTGARTRLGAALQAGSLYVAGVGLVVAPVAIALLVTTSWPILWYDFVAFGLIVQPRSHLPYPPLLFQPNGPFSLDDWLGFYFPFGLALVATGVLIATRRRRAAAPAVWWGMAALVPLTLLLFLQALSRNDEIHRLPAVLTALILLGVLLAPALAALRRPLSNRLARTVIALGVLYYIGLPMIYTLRLAMIWVNTPCDSALPRSGCIYLPRDQQAAVLYVQNHTAPDEPIYVGLRRHDLARINDITFYFLAERPSATAYHDQATITQDDVQMTLRAELESRQVRYLVLWSGSEALLEPNEASQTVGATLLDTYIHAQYHAEAQFGDYAIWRRNLAQGEQRHPGAFSSLRNLVSASPHRGGYIR
jgi:hypothetical protein